MLLKQKEFLGGGTVLLLFAAFLILFFQQTDPGKKGNSYSVRFVRENVSISIAPGLAEVSGCYFMNNARTSTRPVPLYYPFPVSSTSTFPDSIAVFLISPQGQKTISFRIAADRQGIYFSIFLFPQSTTEFQVYYRQRIEGKFVRYILRSTRIWGYPLQEAKFAIRVPKSVEKVRFSLQPDLKTVEKNCIVYQIIRRNFLPKEDLLIWWQ